MIVSELDIEAGQMKRVSPCPFEVTPPLIRMTGDEYTAELDEVLANLPEQFHGFVKEQINDRDYSQMEEMLQFAQGFVPPLLAAVREYDKYKKSLR